MKKMMKKLIAMAAALVMIVTLLPAVGVKAAGENPTVDFSQKGSITMAKTDTSGGAIDGANGGKFDIYKIADLVNANGNQLTYNYVSGISSDQNLSDLGTLTATQLEQFALDMATEVGAINEDGSYKVGNNIVDTIVPGETTDVLLDLGLYLVVEREAPAGFVAGKPFIVDIPRTTDGGNDWNYHVTVHPKNAATDLDLTKTVDDQTVKPGATVNYTIEGSLAYLSAAELEAEDAQITLTDKMSDTLTIGSDEEGNPYDNTSNPLKVTIHNKVDDTYDQVAVTIDTDRHGFTLVIEGENLAKYNGQEFSITYPVVVSDEFTTSSEANNKVTIDSTGDGNPVDTEVDLYTFAVRIIKTGNDGTEVDPNYLDNVKFELYADDEGTLGAKVAGGVTQDGGILTFDELDADKEGTVYWLKEVETVDGYTLLANPVKVTLLPVYDQSTETYTGALEYQIDDGEKLSTTSQAPRVAEISVVNNKGFTLPSTGGMGTYLFTIGGIVIMAGAAFALIAMKKRA